MDGGDEPRDRELARTFGDELVPDFIGGSLQGAAQVPARVFCHVDWFQRLDGGLELLAGNEADADRVPLLVERCVRALESAE